MRLSKLGFLLVLSAGAAFGNSCTAAATGNWSAAGTWASCGGTHPGATDTVAVSAGATITCDLTICTSAGMSASSGNYNFAVSGGSTWEPTANVTGLSNLTFQPGSAMNCLPPASTNVGITIGYGYASPTLLSAIGTSGSRIALTATLGAGNTCTFVQGQVGGLGINWQYADISNLYNASDVLLALGMAGETGDTVVLKQDTVTASGSITFGGQGPSANIDIEDNVWTAGVNTLTNLQTGQSSSAPTGNRLLLGNRFDQTLRLEYPQNWTVKWNVFSNGVFEYDDTGSAWMPTTMAFNFSTAAINNQWQIGGNGTIGANYFYYPVSFVQGGNYDPHFMQVGNAVTSSVTSIIGSLYEYGFAGGVPVNDEGVAILSSSNLTKAYNCIVLPDGSGAKSSGRLFGAPGATSTSGMVAQNNTAANNLSTKTGTQVGEGGSDYTHQLQLFAYNIAYPATPGAGGYAANTAAGSPATDSMAAAADLYNDNYQQSSGTCTNGSGSFSCYGYSAFVFSGANVPGGTDTNVNPVFVDGARNLKKWDLWYGGPGTETDALAKLNAAPRVAVPSLIAYVTQGFTPQNRLLASVNGTYQGAVKPLPAYAGVVGQ